MFDQSIFDEAFEEVAGPIDPKPAPAADTAPRRGLDPGGVAYITVTDAAGRVLFRRAATAGEVRDALRSADVADGEGEAAMDRIAQERLTHEITGPVVPSFVDPDFPFAEGDIL